MELWRGALQSIKQEEEKKKVNELLESLLVYPFREQEAKKSGEIEADLLKKGAIIEFEDIMIAGTALSRNEIILTTNIKHFQKIKGIDVEGC